MCLDFEGSSPSQMIAVCFERFGRWRSMQFWATFVTPSSNHLIETLCTSNEVFLTLENGVIQSIRSPCSAQNPFGSVTERLYIRLYLAAFTQARFAHWAGTS